MQSTLTSRDADPHDIFVVEPDVVLAARDAAPDPISSLLAPPSRPAAEFAATAAVPPVETMHRAPANNDIQIPRDIHVSGERPRGRWAGRAAIGFLLALCSAAAAEGWDHYGDTAKAMIANWTPVALNAFTLNASQPADTTGNGAQPAAPAVQAATADQAPAEPAPAAQPTQATASTSTAPTSTASTAAAPAPDSTQSLQSMAQDVASMGQQIAALKATIDQLKSSQDQMAQQMSREAARTPVARTSQARPSSETRSSSESRSVEQSLRAKVTAALSPRPPAPVRKPRPAYPSAQATMALPPAIAAPQPAPVYEPRAQAVDQADGDTVVRPPMPVR